MIVTALNGSPRRNGNTACLLKTVLGVLEDAGIETKMLQLGGMHLHGCTACGKCYENKDRKCIIDDGMNELMESVFNSDGMLIGSPTYFSNVSTETKAFIDRAGFVALANGGLLRRKVGAAVTAVRRAGAVNVFDAINKFFFINQVIVPGSSYWNLGIGREEGEVISDQEGIRTMKVLGENMGWLMKKLAD